MQRAVDVTGVFNLLCGVSRHFSTYASISLDSSPERISPQIDTLFSSWTKATLQKDVPARRREEQRPCRFQVRYQRTIQTFSNEVAVYLEDTESEFPSPGALEAPWISAHPTVAMPNIEEDAYLLDEPVSVLIV